MNINSNKHKLDTLSISDVNKFPLFLNSLEFEDFKQLKDVKFEFLHPISVIAGANKSGKSTALMAIACSHFNFMKRNPQNGKLERQTWGNLMPSTENDVQKINWTYYISYREGNKLSRKRGQRKLDTKKWNGIGKKESQFKFRDVIFIDTDRILSARNYSKVILAKAKKPTPITISNNQDNIDLIEKYLQHIFEDNIKLSKIATHLDKDIFTYSSVNKYSSYNAATGEEVLLKILIDIVEAKEKSLILIDEIEIGLHPMIQRRLINVLYDCALQQQKQFIITSHSSSILSSLPNASRIFLDRVGNKTNCLQNISVNAALSKMDSETFPLLDIYCEDDLAKLIIEKCYQRLQAYYSNPHELINIIVSGSHAITYEYYNSHKMTYKSRRMAAGFAIILDGDAKLITKKGVLAYPKEDNLFFLAGDKSPEEVLVRIYEEKNNHSQLNYYINEEDNHILFKKMVDFGIVLNVTDAQEICFKTFMGSYFGKKEFLKLVRFLKNNLDEYSKSH